VGEGKRGANRRGDPEERTERRNTGGGEGKWGRVRKGKWGRNFERRVEGYRGVKGEAVAGKDEGGGRCE